MIDLKKEYEDLEIHIDSLEKELSKLKEDSKVKKYIEIKKQNDKLKNMKKRLYTTIKNGEYSSCKHILIFSKVNHDVRGRTYKTCGCIKCGLNEDVLSKDTLTFEETVMKDYLKKNYSYLKGEKIYVDCDLSLGKAIYSKIIETNPNIDDKRAISYFERSLAHIRKNKVNDERKISRAKRLSLKPGFNKWNEKDVVAD